MPKSIVGRRREIQPVVLKVRLSVEMYDHLKRNADDAGLDMAELARLSMEKFGALPCSACAEPGAGHGVRPA